MFKNMRLVILFDMFLNPSFKMTTGFANGGTYFRDIYSTINEKWYKNTWKEFFHLKNIDTSDYYDVNVNKYGVKCLNLHIVKLRL